MGLCHHLKKILISFCLQRNVELENNPPERKLLFQWLFASGQAFSAPEIFGISFAASHYLPFSAGIMRALCTSSGHRIDQTNVLWQVQCPLKWIGRRFGELQMSWLRQQD